MTPAPFLNSRTATALPLEQDPWIRRVIDQELAQARLDAQDHIRATLLESVLTGHTDRLEWARSSRTSRVAGGTFHDVLQRPSGGADIVCETVAASGLEATLAGAMHFVEVLRAMTALGPSAQPSEVLALVKQRLIEVGGQDGASGPALLRVDGQPLTLTLANASGIGVAIRSHDGSVFEPAASDTDEDDSGRPAELVIGLEPGDLILITTHELTTLARRRSRIFNAAGWLCECDADTPADVVEALGAEMARWGARADGSENDVTFVAIAVKPHLFF